MPRNGAYWLEEWPHDLITVRCDTCGLKGQIRKATLLERYGDVPMTELKDWIIQDSGQPCERLKAGVFHGHDRCGAIYDYTKEEWVFWWERHAAILSGGTATTSR